MPKSILLVCGHKNITTITSEGLRSWRSVSSLKGSTGTTGEREWIWNTLMPLLRDRLIAKGFVVYVTDAIYHKETYEREYDLCLALHYDNGGVDSRCIISNPREDIVPEFITPQANAEAKRFISNWLAVYPAQTGITSRQDRVTPGMTDYYVWDYVGVNTPSAIIEHGNYSCPADNDKMFNHPDLIADATIEAVIRTLTPVAVEEDNQYWITLKGVKLAPPYDKNPTDIINDIKDKNTQIQKSLEEQTVKVGLLEPKLEQQTKDNVDLSNQLKIARDKTETANICVGIVSDCLGVILDPTDVVGVRTAILSVKDRLARVKSLEQQIIERDNEIVRLKKLTTDKYTVVRKLVGKYYLVKMK